MFVFGGTYMKTIIIGYALTRLLYEINIMRRIFYSLLFRINKDEVRACEIFPLLISYRSVQ